MKQFFEYLYRFRFFICIICFLLCVLLKIHGSSMSEWNKIIQPGLNNSQYSKPVIGQSKNIRRDEWAIHTPMAMSQKYEDYKDYNSIIRSVPTNMSIVYNQPVKEKLYSILKPFYWGYFFLDEERAFSWYWCGRFIALFLISFEFFQIITCRRRFLSLCGAVFTAFSPAVQWWFAINDFVEMLCWGELGIITVYNYFKSRDKYYRLILPPAAGLCLSGYILCFYPSWQIPFAYIFFAILLWIIIDTKNNANIKKIDILYILICIIIAGLFVISVIIPNFEILTIIKNTKYPGDNFNTGGTFLHCLYLYLLNSKIFTFTNVCELAQFTGFFPLPEIAACIYIFQSKFKDKLLINLLIAEFILCWYLVFGFSDFPAKISLLYMCSHRAAMAVSFISLIILARLLSINFKFKERFFEFLIPLIYSINGLFMILIIEYLFNSGTKYNIQTNKDLLHLLYIILIPVILFIISFLIIQAMKNESKIKKALLISGILFSAIVYGNVNPVMIGFNAVYEIPAYKKIKQIQKEAPGIWLVSDNFPITNFPAMAGAPDISFTNIYPNLNLWKKLDTGEKYINEYNRYANISLHIVFNEKETKFTSPAPDSLLIFLAAEDITKLNVKYIVSTYLALDYIKISDNINLTKIYDEGGFRIFKVNKK